MKCWQRVLTAVSLATACAITSAQQSEHAAAVEAADRVLGTEEFRPAEDAGPIREWLQSFIDWLDGLFGQTESPFTGMGSVLAPIFMAVIIGFLVLLAAWIVANIAGRRRKPEPILSYAQERLAPPHELLRLADEAAARSDYSRAFTLAYWAFLKIADAAGHLDYSDDATNWEILQTLKPPVSPTLTADARKHARLFDEIEYGDSHAGAEEYRAVRELIISLEQVPAAA